MSKLLSVAWRWNRDKTAWENSPPPANGGDLEFFV
jgi:hypothetical protein